MKVTLITTVYNEGDSIEDLWKSVEKQTEKPDEWVIVDGGSDDGTWERLQKLSEITDFIEVFQYEEANISEGRNLCVEHATYDHIVGTDGGCVLNKEFIESFKEKFEDGHKALGGVFKYQAESDMQEVQGIIRTLHHSPEEVEEGQNHPPSHRSAGYTREVWEEVGGYNEELYTGEDSRFNSDVQALGYNWEAVPGAVAYWKMRPTYKDYWRQFELYGQGDCRAGTMFDYHGGLFGFSKVFLMTSATWTGILGLGLSLVSPYALLLAVGGFGMPYAYYTTHLKEAVGEVGVKALPLWGVLVAIQVFGHFTGYYKEWISRKIGFIGLG